MRHMKSRTGTPDLRLCSTGMWRAKYPLANSDRHGPIEETSPCFIASHNRMAVDYVCFGRCAAANLLTRDLAR